MECKILSSVLFHENSVCIVGETNGSFTIDFLKYMKSLKIAASVHTVGDWRTSDEMYETMLKNYSSSEMAPVIIINEDLVLSSRIYQSRHFECIVVLDVENKFSIVNAWRKKLSDDGVMMFPVVDKILYNLVDEKNIRKSGDFYYIKKEDIDNYI